MTLMVCQTLIWRAETCVKKDNKIDLGVVLDEILSSIYMSQAMRKCLMSYANNKGSDQSARMRSLIRPLLFAAWIV